jgi:hypothetical protein
MKPELHTGPNVIPRSCLISKGQFIVLPMSKRKSCGFLYQNKQASWRTYLIVNPLYPTLYLMDENIWIRYRGDDEDLTARSRTPGPGFTATATARYKNLRIIVFCFLKGIHFGDFLSILGIYRHCFRFLCVGGCWD